MGGSFLLISATVNAYNLYRRIKRGISFRDASISIIINSTFLFLLDPIRSGVFNRTWYNEFTPGINYSIVSGLLETGKFMWPTAEKIFQIGALPSIGLGGYMTVFVFWLIKQREGLAKTKRNVIILSIVGILWSVIHEPISKVFSPYVKVLFLKGGIFRFFAYILRILFGAQLSFSPMGIYGIFGIIAGYLLAKGVELKWIQRFGYGFGSLYLVAFLVSTALTVIQAIKRSIDPFEAIFDYEIYPKELLFLSLGCMLLLFPLLVKKFEYVDIDRKRELIKKSLFFRRFGTATLTLYIIEGSIDESIATVFHKLFGSSVYIFGATDAFMYNVWAIILYLTIIVSFWLLFVYGWSKINYRFGFEYLIVLISKPIRKVKSKRLLLETTATESVAGTTATEEDTHT